LRSDWRADDLTNKIMQAVAPVHAVGVFVASQANVNVDEFSAFAPSAHGVEPAARLAWSRLVADGERDAFVNEVRGRRDPGYDIRERDVAGLMHSAARRAE